jgi:ABC-type multidrug transport system permease subunit
LVFGSKGILYYQAKPLYHRKIWSKHEHLKLTSLCGDPSLSPIAISMFLWVSFISLFSSSLLFLGSLPDNTVFSSPDDRTFSKSFWVGILLGWILISWFVVGFG